MKYCGPSEAYSGPAKLDRTEADISHVAVLEGPSHVLPRVEPTDLLEIRLSSQ